MSSIRKLAGQTAIYGLSSILGRMLNYLLVPLYTHFFSNPSDYGVVSELYAYVAFLIVFLTFGMETTFFRFLQDKLSPKLVFNQSFLTILGLNVVFLLVILFFLSPIADAMLYADHPEYIVLLSLIVVADACSALPLAKLRAEQRPRKFAMIQLSSIGTNILLNLVLFYAFFDPEHPEQGVLFIFVVNLVSSLLKPALLYKDFLGIRLRLDPALLKRMWRYALPLVIAGFAGIVNETLDRILLKQLLYKGTEASLNYAEAQVGIYSACYKLAMLVTIFLQAYRYAAEPFFFSQMNLPDKNKMYSRVMNFFVAAVCVIFLLVSLNIDIFKYFITRDEYWAGLDVVPILLLGNVFLGIYFNQSIWYKLSGQTRFGAYIAIGGAVLTILINVLFIPVYGFRASAWATLIVYGAQMVASYFLGQKYYPIKYNLRKFWLYFGAALLIFFIASGLDGDSFTFNLIINNLLILLFIGLVWYIEKPSLRSPNG